MDCNHNCYYYVFCRYTRYNFSHNSVVFKALNSNHSTFWVLMLYTFPDVLSRCFNINFRDKTSSIFSISFSDIFIGSFNTCDGKIIDNWYTCSILVTFPPHWGFLFAKLATYAELNTTCNYIHRSYATVLFVRLFDFMS